MMARTCTNNLRVVFSPYVKHCPCEASEQKWGQKTNIWNKEIELRIWFHSIRLNELVILVCSFVKIWWKMAKLWPWEARAPKWRWPILGHKMAILATFFWDMNFKFVLPIIYINFDIQTTFWVNQTQIGYSIPKKTPKTHQSGHISKPHFAQVSFTKKPTPPTFFNEFVWNFQNQCKYGFCTY